MSWLDRPCATSTSTSRSRGVRVPARCADARERVSVPVAASSRCTSPRWAGAYRVDDLVDVGVLEDVPRGSCREGGVHAVCFAESGDCDDRDARVSRPDRRCRGTAGLADADGRQADVTIDIP